MEGTRGILRAAEEEIGEIWWWRDASRKVEARDDSVDNGLRFLCMECTSVIDDELQSAAYHYLEGRGSEHDILLYGASSFTPPVFTPINPDIYDVN